MSGVFTQSGDLAKDLLFSRSRVDSALCSETKKVKKHILRRSHSLE